MYIKIPAMFTHFEVLGVAMDTVVAFACLFTMCETGDLVSYKMHEAAWAWSELTHSLPFLHFLTFIKEIYQFENVENPWTLKEQIRSSHIQTLSGKVESEFEDQLE